MNTHNIGFYEDLTKIIFELSSNMHLIYSAALWSNVFALRIKYYSTVYDCPKCEKIKYFLLISL